MQKDIKYDYKYNENKAQIPLSEMSICFNAISAVDVFAAI